MTLFFLLEFCISLLDRGNSANSHQLSVLLCCTLHTKGKVPFWRVFRMQVYVSAVTNWVKRVWFLLHPGVSYSSCHLSVENGVNTRHLLCQVHVYSFACVNCIVNIFPSKIYSAILSPLFFVCVFFNFYNNVYLNTNLASHVFCFYTKSWTLCKLNGNCRRRHATKATSRFLWLHLLFKLFV